MVSRSPGGGSAHLDVAPWAAQLNTFGFAVVPPAWAGTGDLVEPVRDALARLSARRNGGVAPDFETGASHRAFAGPSGQQLFYLLDADPVFQDVVLHPVVLSLVGAMLPDAVLSSVTATLKGPGRVPMPLHADQPLHPIPFSLVCNVTFLLTDFDRDAGALCFVPGSHRALRQPSLAENFRVPGMGQAELFARLGQGDDVGGRVLDPPLARPVEAPAGSLVCWHANTWHGAFARRAPGLRASLTLYWCSKWLQPQEAYREHLSEAMLARGGGALARLIGRDVVYGWTAEGPQPAPGAAFEARRARARADGA